MDEIKSLLRKDRYAAHSGIELVEISPGYAKAKMAIHGFHLNAIGIVSGGAIFALADFCFAAASCSRGQVTVTLNANVSYTKAVSAGHLMAEASEVAKTRRIVTYLVKVTDEQSEMVAMFQGMAYRKQR